MNTQEAKFILQAFRSENLDCEDPRMQQALVQVRRDPELARWFEEEKAWDNAMRDQLKRIPVPPDLRQDILAARKISSPERWKYRRAWFAAAAAILLFVGSGAFLLQNDPPDPLEDYRLAMTEFLMQAEQKIQFRGPMDDVRGYLSSQNAASSFDLPGHLGSLSSLGCRVLDWNGRKVSLICFESEDQKVWHLFVVDEAAFQSTYSPDFPRLVREGEFLTATWRQEDKLFLLAGRGEEIDFRRLL